jgi:hypothetical protein
LEKPTQSKKLTNQRENVEKQAKEALIGPTIRGTAFFDANYQSKLEAIEEKLVALTAYVLHKEL